jgi:hypothetical protein
MTENPLENVRVLAACGWERELDEGGSYTCWNRKEQNQSWFDEFPPISLNDLWPALCRVCRENGLPRPQLTGMDAVNIAPCGAEPGLSIGSAEGNLSGSTEAAIAAAIVFVLERKEKP